MYPRSRKGFADGLIRKRDCRPIRGVKETGSIGFESSHLSSFI